MRASSRCAVENAIAESTVVVFRNERIRLGRGVHDGQCGAWSASLALARTGTLRGTGRVDFSVLRLVRIIFSLLFLVVQWALGSLSPRLNLFRDDPSCE